MIHFIEKMLESVENLKVFSTPANKEIFVVDDKATLLSEAERKRFHTLVAKVLFLSKRAGPEVSTANGFLCTRVRKATEEDRKKLFRLLLFLQGTKDLALTLKPKDMMIVAYIDASFGPHADSNSHTGVVLFIGGAPVYVASRKQKCVTKSPTESELVALTDYIGYQRQWYSLHQTSSCSDESM